VFITDGEEMFSYVTLAQDNEDSSSSATFHSDPALNLTLLIGLLFWIGSVIWRYFSRRNSR
jgi:hypothetical protein